jgi:hypothetical protein
MNTPRKLSRAAALVLATGLVALSLRHSDPRVILFDDPELNPMRNLMFNLTLAGYGGDQEKLRSPLHYLSWFLPVDYSVVATPEDWSDDRFVPLA